MRRSFALAAFVLVALLVPADASADFSLRPTLIDGASWRHADRRTVACNPTSVTASGFTCTAQVPTCIAGGGGTVAASPQTNRQFTSYLTNAANLAVGGCNSSGGVTRPGYRPTKYQRMLTDTAITLRREWHGLTRNSWSDPDVTAPDAGIPVLTQAQGAVATPAINFDGIAWGFDTAVDASWMLCSADSTNESCTDSGVDVAVSTEYVLVLDYSVSGVLTGCVNGTCVSKTTNLPTGAINLSFQDTITTLDGTGRTLYLGAMEVTQQ